ncbi:MAG: site-specific integrase [Thermoanaerobacteraceae bacterium]|nr:site-specific integrase [Thermoanaerobacteraceae bacterium]
MPYIHAVLRQALEQAVREGLVYRNVAEAVSPPRQKRKEIRPLTADELNRFLAAARDDRLFPAFLFEGATGLRRGELLGLKWEDVDLERGTVTVRRSLIRTRQELAFMEPKSEKSRRTIPLPKEVVAGLRTHKKRQAGERLSRGPAYCDHGLVFCTEEGRPLDPRNFVRKFEGLLRTGGPPNVSFHDMRHSHATLLLLLGEHPKVVQERLGHSTITVTLTRTATSCLASRRGPRRS